MTEKKTLLNFPCDFTIKVFGKTGKDFESTVFNILKKHNAPLTKPEPQSRQSENGKYLAMSVTIFVESKDQLDKIYQDLSSSPHVLMAL